MKIAIAILLAATALSSPALAQTTAPAPATTAPATSATMPAQANPSEAWRASKLVGVNVYNEQNESLGNISEVILDRSGKVTGFVIGVGGFLGMGVHDVLLAFDQVKFVNEPRASTTAARPATTGTAPAGTPAAGAPATGATPSGAPPAATARQMDNRPVAATNARRSDEKWFPDHAVVSATKDQLKNMQQFKYD
ncbi:MAG: PRC-barrel domain-containing protein [Pseudolabrys sp.]|nr:PRC-barrel domain-containing protein [Pseudolabrys sp.]